MRRVRLLLVIALLLSASLFVPEVAAQDELGDSTQELERLNIEIERKSGRLDEVSARVAAFEREATEVRAAITAAQKRQREVAAQQGEVAEQRQLVEQQLQEGAQAITRLEQLSKARLRTLYMQREQDLVGRLFAATSTAAVERAALYLARVRDYDRRLMTRLAEERQAQEARAAELSKLMVEQEQLRAAAEQEAQRLASRLNRQNALRKELGVEKQRLEEALTALRAQVLRLEMVVASLTSGARAEIPTPARTEPSRESRELPPFDGPGLFRLKGSLATPARGRLVRGYGRYKLGGLQEQVFSKGVELATSEGSEVVAIADGQVLFSGRMPVYGRIVILDHGQRYYSLYGKLAEARVARGARVKKGESLGTTGALPPEEGNFYFEVRKDGAPVDPRTYLPGFARPPGGSAR